MWNYCRLPVRLPAYLIVILFLSACLAACLTRDWIQAVGEAGLNIYSSLCNGVFPSKIPVITWCGEIMADMEASFLIVWQVCRWNFLSQLPWQLTQIQKICHNFDMVRGHLRLQLSSGRLGFCGNERRFQFCWRYFPGHIFFSLS